MKNFIYNFFLILIINGNTIAYGMTKITQPRRLIPHRTPMLPTIIYPTKAYQQPIFIDRLAQYYDQVKNRISEFWYGKTHPTALLDKTTMLLKEIKMKQPGFINDFDIFIQEKNQATVNTFLSRLIFSEN